MRQVFTIQGAFSTRNEGEALARTHWSKAARLKKEETARAVAAAKGAHLSPVDGPVDIGIIFHEQVRFFRNGKRRKLHDVDNWFYGTKPILDGLVEAGILPDDGPDWVRRVLPVVAYTLGEPWVTVTIMDYKESRTVTYPPATIPERRDDGQRH